MEMSFLMGLLLAIVGGGVVYRVRGMGVFPGRPWVQALFAAPYAVAALAMSLDWLAAVFVLVLTTGALLTGHGSYLRLGEHRYIPADGHDEEWYGSWLPWPGTYLHDFLGLAVSGLLITAPLSIAAAIYREPGIALAVLASGLLKPCAYAIAKFSPSCVDRTAVGEVLCGAFLWGSLVLAGLV